MKLALCNEVLAELAFEGQCTFARGVGYEGLELAPYTLAEDPGHLSATRRAEVKRIAADAGVPIAGLHWLLVTPEGLSITTDDPAVRAKTVDLMRRLIDLCADLGGDYLVHGSPGQRRLPEDDPDAARQRGIDAWAAIAEDAAQAGVIYCIEALAEPEANFVNTMAEAAGIVDAIGVPALRTMVDCSAAGKMEAEPVAVVLDRGLTSGHVAHIQVNDRNRRGPGQGEDDLAPVVATLDRHQYKGWIAVEPFDYRPDGPSTAAYCAGYMRALIKNAGVLTS